MSHSTHQAIHQNPAQTTQGATNTTNRYARQMQVEQLTKAGQAKLANANVAIVGMGGLGCPLAQYLVGAGVGSKLSNGSLTLIDHDEVSESNLHRQILYCEKDVGKSKADVAVSRLLDLNSQIDLVAHRQRLTPDNIDQLLSTTDIIVDATDNFAISYLLSDYALQQQKPLVSASVIGVKGYLGVFCRRTDTSTDTDTNDCSQLTSSTPLPEFSPAHCDQQSIPSLRAVFPNPPQVGQDCNSLGVIGTSAGIIGTLQAQEVIKVILGDSAQLAGRLLSLDLWNYRQTLMDFNQAKEPDVIARIISQADITSDDLVVDVRNQLEVIQQPKTLQNIDIQHIPMHELNDHHLPTNRRIVLTCHSGQRALTVADNLLESGFDNISVWI